MEIDFDSELLWDIWYYFIVYGTIIIFGLSLLRKFSLYKSLKGKLGKDYQTIPDLSKIRSWRKYLVIILLIISLLMFLYSLIRMESFIYILPVIFVTGIVYLNGKLKGNFWDIQSTFFYGEKSFCLYPGRNKLYSLSFYKWSNIEKLRIRESGSVRDIKVKIKDKKGLLLIRNKKTDSEKIKNIFIDKGIVVENSE